MTPRVDLQYHIILSIPLAHDLHAVYMHMHMYMHAHAVYMHMHNTCSCTCTSGLLVTLILRTFLISGDLIWIIHLHFTAASFCSTLLLDPVCVGGREGGKTFTLHSLTHSPPLTPPCPVMEIDTHASLFLGNPEKKAIALLPAVPRQP